ncbi:MAG TPA: hypothetical protein VKU60_13240, partial [Chloroflexota bacterium]|nr:hypothetical protein [Chloroflexota bacterium]
RTEESLLVFAANVRAAGADWRPLAVEPQRLEETVRAIHPSAVVIDATMDQAPVLLSEVRGLTHVEPLVLGPAELPQLQRKIA